MDADPAAFRPAPATLIVAADAARAGHYPADDPALHRVRRGVYTPRTAWEDLAEWDRYLLRVHALALTRGDAVFSHESAAALWGLPLFGHPLRIHLFDSRRTRSLTYGDVTAHTSEEARSHVERDGIRSSTASDTVIDLARTLPPAMGLSVADAAARAGLVDPAALLPRAESQRNRWGRHRMMWVLSRIDARSESVTESLSRAVIEWCGFPPPDLQTEHRVEGRLYRSDLCWPEHRVIGEADGWAKYAAGAVEAVREEKRREDALRRAGWRIARWDYAGALQAAPLRAALLAAGLPLTGRADTANLAAVGRNPRST
jgi:hypothetical protein